MARSRKRRDATLEAMLLPTAMLGYGWRLMETGMHASAVITRRSLMLAQALSRGDQLTDPEFARMVTEKAAAAGEAWASLARHATTAAAAGAGCGAADAVSLAEACLKPYHRRVRANAKRLGRRRASSR